MIVRNDELYFVEVLHQRGNMQLEFVINKKTNQERYNIWDNHRCFITDFDFDYKKIMQKWNRGKK